MNNSNYIYLAGSYIKNFRDQIIEALPNVKFRDPRDNRQAAMYAMNTDDLEGSIECPTMVACFPEGKAPGVMTFVELGAAFAAGNDIFTANELPKAHEVSDLLEQTASKYFKSIENGLIPFLKDWEPVPKESKQRIEKLGPINDIYFCGDLDRGLDRMAEFAEKIRPDKNYHFKSADIIEDFENLKDYDMIVAHFPTGEKLDRKTMFMLGGAVYNHIPVIMKIDGVFPYPPISGGLQRRLVNDFGGLLDYIVSVDDAAIAKEASHMYQFFQRYDKTL